MAENEGNCLEDGNLAAATLPGLLAEIGKIAGYKASAIMTGGGEVLYCTTPPQQGGSAGAWPQVFNALFDKIANPDETSGLFGWQHLSLRTGNETVIVRPAGQHRRIGLRLLVVIDQQGNDTLAHQELDNLLPPLIRLLNQGSEQLFPWFPESQRPDGGQGGH